VYFIIFSSYTLAFIIICDLFSLLFCSQQSWTISDISLAAAAITVPVGYRWSGLKTGRGT